MKEKPLNIVPLAPAHKELIRKLLCDTNAFRSDEIDVAIELIDAYLNKTDDYQLYTAIDDQGTVLGYVCFGKTPVTLTTFDLYWIATAIEAQGKGVGQALFDFTCNAITKQGGKLVVIETSSQPKYEKTWRFYEKIGCTVEARIKDFYAPGDDKLIYTKHL
ncbi:MAG: GNAT family N-acetyltransferase [Chlorobiales bacterium]|nr:GNAT family N-acetyltransferase [Chlorobiales bacterium]